MRATFVPIVNYYFLLKIVGRPGWWLHPLLHPVRERHHLLDRDVRPLEELRHGFPFWLGLVFLSLFFLLWLSYSGDRYVAPAGGGYGAISSRGGPPPIPSAESGEEPLHLSADN